MRGGKRKNAGRKSSWEGHCQNEKTTHIRVPKKLIPSIMKVAHYMDKNELSFEKLMAKLDGLKELEELTDTLYEDVAEANQLIDEQKAEIIELQSKIEELNEF